MPGEALPIQKIHTFLVKPGKGGHEKLEINGTEVPLSGGMFNLLSGIYERSEEECDIQISFCPTSDGKQKNECRDLVVKHLSVRNVDSARVLAERLRDVTDGRSGLGLLFVIIGKDNGAHKIVISRFPTDSAIFVDENPKNFTVAFLERVFMKNKTSYKAVVYKNKSLEGDFWTGRAIDKQIDNRAHQLSDYWIADFLLSTFATTPALGSRRLGQALRDAVSRAPLEVKEELIAAGKLANGLAGKPITINTFAGQFNLSDAAKTALVTSLKNPKTANEQFILDISEFRNYVAYRSVQLDNGALLTAESSGFDDVFERQNLDDGKGLVEYSTRGRIIDEKFKAKL